MDVTVAVDCMGGDHGPHVTVPAAMAAIGGRSDVDLVLVGLRDAIEAELRARGAQPSTRLRIHHASEIIAMNEPIASALRSKRDSSMRVAVNLVKSGEAQACVSAGNTGALMAVSRFVLRMLPAARVAFPDMEIPLVLDAGAARQSMPFGMRNMPGMRLDEAQRGQPAPHARSDARKQ